MGNSFKNRSRILRGEIEEIHWKIMKKIFSSGNDPEETLDLAETYKLILEQIRKMPNQELRKAGKNSKPRVVDKEKIGRDDLTGLYNRSVFVKEKERLANNKFQPVAMVICDINRLKSVNDNEGHAKGDELIKLTAKILQESFSFADIVCRIGGDEFAILISKTEPEKVEECCDNTLRVMQKYNKENYYLKASLSIGYAVKKEEEDMSTLFKRADRAMYDNKIKSRMKNLDD
jgi:diguanylate cyclase (GGDEF)-like protein